MVIWLFGACRSTSKSEFGGDISRAAADIAAGEDLFQRYCSACHNFQQNGIGPQLGGVTRMVDNEWIKNFIQNAAQVMRDKDPRAVSLFEEYQTYMPSFENLTAEELDQLLAFMHTFEAPEDPAEKIDLPVVEDPIRDTVVMSETMVELTLVTQIPASADKPPLARINKMECTLSGRLFVADLRGKLYELVNDLPQVYLDLSELKPNFIDRPGLGTGLGSFAFHPDFEGNGLFYTTHSEAPNSAPADEQFAANVPTAIQYVLSEWKADDPTSASFVGTHRELLRMDMVTGRHGFQEIGFNPTAEEYDEDFGNLYITVGDGACVEEGYPEYSYHKGTQLWSAILRIDPLGDNARHGKYGIPQSNPFAKDPNKRSELYAYGFRNPNQLSWDEKGNLYATDIGLRQIEEINLVEPGAFYGWPIREGSFFLNHRGNLSRVYPLPDNDSEFNITYPVVSLDHDETRAIVGGYFYDGSKLPGLQGQYVYGDITSGRLFHSSKQAMQLGAKDPIYEWQISLNGTPTNLREVSGSNRVDLRFGQDCEGDLYIMTKSDGKIYRLQGINL